ncbi:unnamed protein product [Ranitomeya imitator]|uniref:Uncharacterized protein n=1 Tax=Ranitomeya imitator TaxID=111125 RepID=A0ABN9LG51_9NEOB|nr:unnamed protein product [Ranitomeya imitator]
MADRGVESADSGSAWENLHAVLDVQQHQQQQQQQQQQETEIKDKKISFNVFAAAGLRLSSILHTFSNQLEDDDKPLLLLEIEKLVPLSQQLQITSRTTVQGKTATFTKVDTCIQKSKAVMMILSQVLPICCKLQRKCKVGNGCYRPPGSWKENKIQNVSNEDGLEGKTVEAFGVKSLEHHVANLTFLESK